MKNVLVDLPLPPKALSPNSRPTRRAKISAVRAYRTTAWAKAYEATGGKRYQWRQAYVCVSFHFKDRRQRDGDNLVASLKAAFDGLVDAGLILSDAAIPHDAAGRLDDRQGLVHGPLRIYQGREKLIVPERQREFVRIAVSPLADRPPAALGDLRPGLIDALAGMIVGLVNESLLELEAPARRVERIQWACDWIYPREAWPASSTEVGAALVWAIRRHLDEHGVPAHGGGRKGERP